MKVDNILKAWKTKKIQKRVEARRRKMQNESYENQLKLCEEFVSSLENNTFNSKYLPIYFLSKHCASISNDDISSGECIFILIFKNKEAYHLFLTYEFHLNCSFAHFNNLSDRIQNAYKKRNQNLFCPRLVEIIEPTQILNKYLIDFSEVECVHNISFEWEYTSDDLTLSNGMVCCGKRDAMQTKINGDYDGFGKLSIGFTCEIPLFECYEPYFDKMPPVVINSYFKYLDKEKEKIKTSEKDLNCKINNLPEKYRLLFEVDADVV